MITNNQNTSTIRMYTKMIILKSQCWNYERFYSSSQIFCKMVTLILYFLKFGLIVHMSTCTLRKSNAAGGQAKINLCLREPDWEGVDGARPRMLVVTSCRVSPVSAPLRPSNPAPCTSFLVVSESPNSHMWRIKNSTGLHGLLKLCMERSNFKQNNLITSRHGHTIVKKQNSNE